MIYQPRQLLPLNTGSTGCLSPIRRDVGIVSGWSFCIHSDRSIRLKFKRDSKDFLA